jgi:hypothetical protein
MRRHFTLSLFLLSPLLVAEESDRLVLTAGDTLTGTVSTISADGRVTLVSSNAAAPLELKQKAMQRIVFDPTDPPEDDYSEIIALSNGDKIPGSMSTLDATTIGFETNYANLLTIPRKETRSIDFGVRPQRLVFSGSGKLSEWEENNNWQSSGKALTNSGAGTIGHSDLLPAQFILKFRLEWEGNPSLRFYFCDKLLKGKGDPDRYYFEFNASVMRIMREVTGEDRRPDSIATIRRGPSSFPDDQADIELRVDREQGLIYLYINGKSEGRHRDHRPTFPSGSGIMIQSMSGGDMKNIVSGVEIYDWDAVSQVRSDEGHEDTKQDSVISTNGQRFSGVVDEMITRDDGSLGVVFSSPHSDDSFTIPNRLISTLYFRRKDPASTPPSTDCTVVLTNNGQLQLSNIQLGGERLTGTHPLLGDLSIDRETIARLDYPSRAKPVNSESSE